MSFNILVMFGFLVFYFCFLFCVSCVFVLFCVLFLLLYIAVSFLFLYMCIRLLPPGGNPTAVNIYHIKLYLNVRTQLLQEIWREIFQVITF
jgi:hypothetical protein